MNYYFVYFVYRLIFLIQMELELMRNQILRMWNMRDFVIIWIPFLKNIWLKSKTLIWYTIFKFYFISFAFFSLLFWTKSKFSDANADFLPHSHHKSFLCHLLQPKKSSSWNSRQHQWWRRQYHDLWWTTRKFGKFSNFYSNMIYDLVYFLWQ